MQCSAEQAGRTHCQRDVPAPAHRKLQGESENSSQDTGLTAGRAQEGPGILPVVLETTVLTASLVLWGESENPHCISFYACPLEF